MAYNQLKLFDFLVLAVMYIEKKLTEVDLEKLFSRVDLNEIIEVCTEKQ